MSYYVVKEPHAEDFSRIGVSGKIFPTYSLTSQAQCMLLSSIEGQSGVLTQNESDVLFYIIDGSGTFTVRETQEECSTGDLVVVPMGSSYTFTGTMKMFCVFIPPWEEEQEEMSPMIDAPATPTVPTPDDSTFY